MICFQISVPFKSSNSGLPMPTPQLPPTLFPATFTSLDPVSGGSTKPAALDTLDTLDDLDDLDDLVDLDDLSYSANGGGVASLGALDALDDLDALDELCDTTPSVCEWGEGLNLDLWSPSTAWMSWSHSPQSFILIYINMCVCVCITIPDLVRCEKSFLSCRLSATPGCRSAVSSAAQSPRSGNNVRLPAFGL